MNSYLQHTQIFTIAVDEVDFFDRIKPSAILQYFQDLATVHATEIGIGYEKMKEDNLCWILSRLSVVIEKYPKLGEVIKVITYPLKPHMVDAIRDYYIYDMNDNLLIRGTSKWCVIDTQSRAIRRCGPMFSFSAEQYMPTISIENGNSKIADIQSIGVGFEAFKSKALITDLDRNMHMNNARYGDIILNACDFDFLTNNSVKSFDINFLSELKINDEYHVNKINTDNFTLFEAMKQNETVFRAQVSWQKYE